MKSVFSFSLFGSEEKYCRGLLRNLEIIHEKFPTFETWVYIGNDVPAHILNTLSLAKNVRLLFTGETGLVNKLYRFFAIDDASVDVMFVRDVDSRINDRDISTIHEFLESNKLFHIVRDHPNHFHKIMACSFAIKKGLLNGAVRDIFNEYRKTNEVNTFWDDQIFLAKIFYPHVLPFAMIHDDVQTFEPEHIKTVIKSPILNGRHFIGQVYEFDAQGNEYAKFTDYFEGGVHGRNFWTPGKLNRLGISSLPSSSSKKVNLFIQVFQNVPSESDSDETKAKKLYRNSEYEQCFLTNLSHEFIQKIFIFYEKEEDKEHYTHISNEYTHKTVFIKHWKQAYYKDFLEYIDKNIPEDEICCILAGDIYLNYDLDLGFFDKFLPKNTVFAITRHEFTDKYHRVCDEKTCELAHGFGGCSDCFFFRTPIPKSFDYNQVDHRQNRWGGECNFCHAWHKTGARILNPCYQVKTIHIHKDQAYFNQHPDRVTYGRPYLPELEPAPKDSNHCINRPGSLYEPGTLFCFRCKAHPNAFCKWHKGGKDWTCNICDMYNKFEERDWARHRALNPGSV